MKTTKAKLMTGLLALSSISALGAGGAITALADTADTDTTVYISDYNPDDPTDGSDLELLYTPAIHDFQSHVAGTAITATAPQNGTSYVAFQDKRTDASTDWELSVSAGNLTSGGNSLVGSLTFDVGDVKDYTPSDAPSTTNIGATTAGLAPQDVTVDLGGSASTVVTSTAGTRQGYALEINGVELNVAQGVTNAFGGETFRGKVTWTLDDTI